jgi:3-methyladenine DNA glycosylase AlkD
MSPRSPSLRNLKNPEKARILSRFFKTGPGEYGEGDRFLGIPVPLIRDFVKKHHRTIDPEAHSRLLASPYHEERLAGLLLWVQASKMGDELTQNRIAREFLRRKDSANNWDLIDVCVPDLLGPSLLRREPFMTRAFRSLLRSKKLWDRRIAILSTFHSIRNSEFGYALTACKAVLSDREDLIHKASGWMLREVGKRDLGALRAFLISHASHMPRTMLRYSIERLPEAERKRWMRMD